MRIAMTAFLKQLKDTTSNSDWVMWEEWDGS